MATVKRRPRIPAGTRVGFDALFLRRLTGSAAAAPLIREESFLQLLFFLQVHFFLPSLGHTIYIIQVIYTGIMFVFGIAGMP